MRLSLAVPTTLAVAGLTAALLTPVPATAQEPVCPNVAYGVTQEQMQGPAGEPVTLTFSSDVQPAKTPDRWTFTRIAPAPTALLQTAPSGPEATFTFAPSETTTYRVTAEGPEGCGPVHSEFTRTISPTGNGGSDYCFDPATGQPYQRPARSFTATPRAITAGEPVTVALRIPGPYNRVEADIRGYQWVTPTQQGGYETLSSTGSTGPYAPGETATRTVIIAPTGNTKVSWGGALYCGPGGFHGDVFDADPIIINVAPRLTLGATRSGTRTYVFSGVATTPTTVVNLFRVNADGSEVLTAQTRATAERRWSITRKFLGSGRFGFVVRTGQTMANVPGKSNVRPTLIH